MIILVLEYLPWWYLKSAAELETMREAGRFVALTLRAVSAQAKAGVSLLELDDLARAMLGEHGAKSSFLDYLPVLRAGPVSGRALPVGERPDRARHPRPAAARRG